jgi:hypothetical protein
MQNNYNQAYKNKTNEEMHEKQIKDAYEDGSISEMYEENLLKRL